VDGGWKTCGVAAEISARIAESDIFRSLRALIIRVSLPDTLAPASSVFYLKNGLTLNIGRECGCVGRDWTS